MKFQLDTSDVAKGFRDYKSAVEGIFTSLDKFEAHVNKTMAGVAKASANPQALNAFKKAVQGFSSVDIDASAAKKLSALSAAMAGFKAPSATQATNTKKFFTSLGGMPDLSAALRSVKALASVKDAMANFKAPSAGQAKNLAAFGAAAQSATPGLMSLSKISGISGIANELASISIAMRNLKAPNSSQVTNIGNLGLALKQFNFANLAGAGNLYQALGAIANFKAPGAGQIRNLEAFITAVSNIKVPPNANAVAAALHNIAFAANQANGSLGGFRTGFGGTGATLGTFGKNTKTASIQMMGLQNAMSGTFQAGSLLRSLLGSLTIGEIGRNFFEASNGAMQFQAQMGVISKETGFAGAQLEYVNATANKFGMDMLRAEEGFGKISIAANKAGISVGTTKSIFEGFSTEMAVLGVSTAKQNDAWLAVQQVMNKGYLSAEELNQQLNEVMPGAMAYAGEYAKKLGTNLQDGLKSKVLDATGVLTYMAKRMREDFGPAMGDAMMRPAAQMQILKNNVNSLFQAIGKSGGNQAFAKLLGSINSKMTPDAIDRYAAAIGEGLGKAVDRVTKAFQFLYDNWDSIKGPLATTLSLLGKWMIVSSALQIGKSLVMPLVNAGRAAAVAGPLFMDLVRATQALSAANLTGFLTNLQKINNPAIVAGTTSLSTALGKLGATSVGSQLASSFAGVPSVVKGVATAVGGLAAAIGTGLTTAWAIATSAARDSANGAVDIQYSAGEIITGMWLNATDGIGKMWDQMSTYVGELGDWLAKTLGFNFGDILDVAGKVAYGIYYGFIKAFETVMRAAIGFAQGVGNTIGSIGSALSMLVQGDFSGAASKAAGAAMGKDMMAGFHDSFKTMKFSAADMASGREDLGMGRNAIAGWLNDQGKRGRGPAKPAAPKRAGVTDIYDKIGERPDLQEPGSGKGKHSKGRHPKAQSAEAEANKVENAVDQLMAKFKEVDPIGEMYHDFVKNLTDEAHVLLNEKGYANFLDSIKGKAGDTQAQTQALVAVMANAGNLSDKTMKDLNTRYGKGVQGMIDLLIAQQSAYEDGLKKATIDAVDFTYKGAKDLMEGLGDTIPRVQQLSETISKLTPLATAALSSSELKKWLSDLRSGATDASMAGEDLAGSIVELAKTSPTLAAHLKQIGVTAEEAAASARSMGNALDYTRRMAERDIPFGAKTTREMDQETIKASMMDREAGIYDKLTTAVKDYLAAGSQEGPLTQDKIASLDQEIRKRQELADQMKRNKDFFENNGVRGYVNDLKTAGEAAQELDKTVLQGLEDQLFNLGKTGQFSFNAIFDSIQDGILRMASQNITKSITDMIFPKDQQEGGNPTLFGGLFKMMGDTGPRTTAKLGENLRGSSATLPMWVKNVNVNETTGDLTTDKRPSVLVEGAANDNGVGGSPAAADRSTTGKAFDDAFKDFPAPSADPKTTIDKATAATATSFSTTLGNMMPMIGMAFAGSFKSPIAQVGAMFLSMMLQQMMTSQAGGAGGGLGGILGKIGGLFGGGGGAGAAHSLGGALAGAFKEGGYTNSPVTMGSVHAGMFTNAPHYKEGTANTSGGGIPAILHDNEAVIPLSRGRKIPVEMGGAQRGQSINNNFNISSPDADSFRKSRQQIAAEMHMSAGRAYRRNNG